MRLFKSEIHHLIKDKKFFKSARERELYDPVIEEYKKKTVLQKYTCFYPQQRVITKFYEKNCDTLAMSLWKKAYPDVDHEAIVSKVYSQVETEVNKSPFMDVE